MGVDQQPGVSFQLLTAAASGTERYSMLPGSTRSSEQASGGNPSIHPGQSGVCLRLLAGALICAAGRARDRQRAARK